MIKFCLLRTQTHQKKSSKPPLTWKLWAESGLVIDDDDDMCVCIHTTWFVFPIFPILQVIWYDSLQCNFDLFPCGRVLLSVEQPHPKKRKVPACTKMPVVLRSQNNGQISASSGQSTKVDTFAHCRTVIIETNVCCWGLCCFSSPPEVVPALHHRPRLICYERFESHKPWPCTFWSCWKLY